MKICTHVVVTDIRKKHTICDNFLGNFCAISGRQYLLPVSVFDITHSFVMYLSLFKFFQNSFF